ncbi:MAG: sorbosone dehydrogenase family protein [Halobacteria archaeon]
MDRRSFIASLGFLAAGCTSEGPGGRKSDSTDGGVSDSGGGGSSPESSGASVSFEGYSSGYRAPLAMASGGGEVFVADQVGVLYRVTDDGKEQVFDLRDRIGDNRGEKGLLGVALHPEFGDNGKLYLRYSAPLKDYMPTSYSHTFALSKFVYANGEVDGETETRLLEIPEPQGNHNSGSLTFGPEGYLYVGVGDGGAAGDRGKGHVSDWYGGNPGGNGQDITKNLLGSILRIDVDGSTGSKNYSVPDDNPLVDEAGRDEIYAWGIRNPWGMSFNEVDGEEKLFVADVGQNRYEEIDIVENGGNYGWNVREGSHCYGNTPCPSNTPDGEPLIDPIVEYSHDIGISVIGGYVYRGSGALEGSYVFGDLNGKMFAASKEDGEWNMSELEKGEGGPSRILGFGRSGDDVYVLGIFSDGGAVKKIKSS